MLSYLSVLSAYLKTQLACQKRAGGYDLISKNTETRETGQDFFFFFFLTVVFICVLLYVNVYFVHCLSLVWTRRLLSQPNQTRLGVKERCHGLRVMLLSV